MPLPYTSTQHKVVAKCMRFGFRVYGDTMINGQFFNFQNPFQKRWEIIGDILPLIPYRCGSLCVR